MTFISIIIAALLWGGAEGVFSAAGLCVFDLCIVKAMQARQTRRDTQRMIRKPPPTVPPTMALRFAVTTKHHIIITRSSSRELCIYHICLYSSSSVADPGVVSKVSGNYSQVLNRAV